MNWLWLYIAWLLPLKTLFYGIVLFLLYNDITLVTITEHALIAHIQLLPIFSKNFLDFNALWPELPFSVLHIVHCKHDL